MLAADACGIRHSLQLLSASGVLARIRNSFAQGGRMKKLLLTVVLGALVLAGCATPPPPATPLAKAKLTENQPRIGVVMAPLPKVDTHLPGAGCLLCMAAAALANQSLTAQVQQLPQDGLLQVKEDIAKAINKKGGQAVVIATEVKVDELPKFSGAGGLIAERDFRSFREKHKLDKLVVVEITTLGAERPYSAYVPTGAPKGVFRAVGYMVNLQTNAYEWYQPVEFLKAADGSWDEPPTFPGVTNAYFQALELGKDAIVENFN